MATLVFLGLSVLDLGAMYVTCVRQTSDRQTSDRRQTASSLNASALWGRRHNKYYGMLCYREILCFAPYLSTSITEIRKWFSQYKYAKIRAQTNTFFRAQLCGFDCRVDVFFQLVQILFISHLNTVEQGNAMSYIHASITRHDSPLVRSYNFLSRHLMWWLQLRLDYVTAVRRSFDGLLVNKVTVM